MKKNTNTFILQLAFFTILIFVAVFMAVSKFFIFKR